MTFAYPPLLWFLLAPAALLLAAGLLRARTTSLAHPKIPRAQLSNQLSAFVIRTSSSGFSPRPVAALLALACLILALARPQGATLSTPSFTQARDVLVAVDVSRSMLAEDVTPTRLARAQLLIRNLADELKGERLGLLPFAGTAFLQSPLSGDYEIFRTFLDELGPDMIPAGGSNFAALLQTADAAFGPPDTDASLRPDRYLIILSDGEAQDDTWRPLAQKLADRGVRVLALGLGTADGAMVPDGQGALVKDERGAVVLSRLNPATLQSLARATDGTYLNASTWVDVPALLRDTIARGRTARAATDTAPRREELFVRFLAPALALLAFALLREFPVTPRHVSTRPLQAPPAPPLPRATTLARLLALAALLHSSFVITDSSFASETPEAADELVTLVGQLASAPELPPADLARLADLTATRGEAARSPAPGSPPPAAGKLPPSAIQDALAAVALGQSTAPSAADWPTLRSRLQALLAPPPSPQKNDQSKSDDSQKSDKSKSSENQKSDSSSSPQSSPDQKSDPSQSASGDQSSDPSQSSENSPSAPSDSTTQKTTGEKPLGDLASPKPDEKDASSADPASSPSSDEKSADQPPAPSPSDTPPDSPDTPTQTVGGVSSSGRPDDPSADPAASAAALDPALVIPQQRLERVRESDAPARLFQLLQDSELPPDAAERRASGNKRDW